VSGFDHKLEKEGHSSVVGCYVLTRSEGALLPCIGSQNVCKRDIRCSRTRKRVKGVTFEV
jgi:hypothetical protein